MQQSPIGPVAFLSLILLGGNSQPGGTIMFFGQGSPQDIDNARVALVLAVAGFLMFWRFLLRVVLAILAVAVGVGAVVLMQSMHH
jgi:hypothetical protein